MRKFSSWLGVMLLVLLGSAHGAVPSKIAVMDIAALEIMYDLDLVAGLEEFAVVDNVYVDYLPKLSKLNNGHAVRKIGNLFAVDMEQLNAMRPDYVLVGLRSQSQIKAIEQVSKVVDYSIVDDLFTGAINNINRTAKLFNVPSRGAALIAKLEAQRQAVAKLVPKTEKAMLIMISGNKVSLFGANSRFGKWYEQSLGINLLQKQVKSGNHGAPISFEYIAQQNPDRLLVIDRNRAIGDNHYKAAADILDNPLVRTTKAWRAQKITYLNAGAGYISVGGSMSLRIMLTELQAAYGGK